MSVMDVYYDISNPAGFGGMSSLQRATSLPAAKVKKFLDEQRIYRKYKVPNKKIKRARVHVATLGIQFQSDLFDLSKLSRHNNGYKWILLVVDAFSRYVKCEPLKNKTGPEVSQGLEKIFTALSEEGKLAPTAHILTDLGNEFFNKHADKVYKKFGLAHSPLRAPIKCGIAEISGRYIVEKLYKYMDYESTKRWVDVLQSVVQAKNSRKNRRTDNLAPTDINFVNQKSVYSKLYPDGVEPAKFTLNLGDRVQVVKSRLPFAKSHHGYYTDKTYRVVKQHAHDVPRYSIVDEEDNEPIAGTWYAAELYKI